MQNDIGSMTRREWLQLTAMAAVGTAAGPSLLAQRNRPLGVQLYTVRDKLGADADATLQAIASIGYKEVELLRGHAARIAPLAKAHGLESVSMHIEPPLLTGDWEPWAAAVKPEDRSTLERTLGEAKTYGVQYAVVSYLMPGERGGGQAFFEKFADQLNHARSGRRQASRSGITTTDSNSSRCPTASVRSTCSSRARIPRWSGSSSTCSGSASPERVRWIC
jgi:hypothetical protein